MKNQNSALYKLKIHTLEDNELIQLSVPIGLQQITARDFATILLYEQYAAAAYCGTNFNNASATTTLVCNTRNCDMAMTATVAPGSKFFG